ncbi:MAG: UDP-N-acetylglucosamine 1-carboxyvinyltransferase [Oscillospiraceae bacterium]|nr:UDP-N-acetylglucosamine 1-carboxyvinyltransferase [Oscillospiraceae bacterium]
MSEIIISGGKRLEGAVHVHGAKNSVLPILAATILSGSVSVIHNCPRLSDVDATVAILEHLGCRVNREGQTVTVDSSTLDRCDIPDHLMREMRSSVIFLGAVLARTGEARLCAPGGCELGPRPIDLHLAALRRLGADIREKGGDLRCRTKGLRGTEISLTIPSVGATENAMLAACGAKGETVIYNAAREPEIVDLQQFLNACGARVRGAGSSAVVVEGGIPLHMAEYTVMADRICAATYLSAAAIAGGEIEVEGVPRSQLVLITDLFSAAGCRIRAEERRIWLESDGKLRSVPPVRTAPYPGFPTDAQPPVMAALTKARGTTVFVETMFENRYRHTQELVRMGADIRVEGRVAVVCGTEKLHGANLEAADLRGGAALVVAALGAEGESRISGLHHIDRGYADLTERLAAMGGAIYRN